MTPARTGLIQKLRRASASVWRGVYGRLNPMSDVSPAVIAKILAIEVEKRQTMPLRLNVAARVAFPDGTMGAAGLRKERNKGHLVTEMIAGKEYTTLTAIERMREKCRVQRKAPALSGGKSTGKKTDRSGAAPAGTSKIAADVTSQDATRAHLQRLKDSLPSKRGKRGQS